MAKTAVVLAGGGSRGAYQIGVWRAMKELGISWDIVTGASVGALNGALMVQGDYDVAQSLWENITSKEVMRDVLDEEKLPSLDDRTVWRTFIKDALRQGGADISPLEDMIRRLVDEEKLRASPVDFALITVEYPSMKPLELRKGDIPKGMVAEYLLASAACFPAFKIKEIGDAQYIDGGYYDNLPINLAIDMGAEVVIAVDLHSVGLTRRVKAGAYQITTIQPRWPLGPFILFEKGTAQRNMALGYLDAMKAFGRLAGWLYAFPAQSCESNTRRLYPAAAELAAKASSHEPGLCAALEKLLRRRLYRDFRSKNQQKEPFNIGKAITMAAEYCGAALEVEPTKQYRFEDFNALLTNAFAQVEPLDIEGAVGVKKLSKAAGELSKVDTPKVIRLIYQRLKAIITGEEQPLDLLLLLPVFWKEILAAMYLLTLESLLPQQE